MRRVLVGFVLFLTACSQSLPAPAIGQTETVCTDVFCIDVPEG